MIQHWTPRFLAAFLILFLTACPPSSPGGGTPIPPGPGPVPPISLSAKEILTRLAGSDQDKRQAAARLVFARSAEGLEALIERYGKNAMLQFFIVGASSEDDETRKMAMSALGANLSGEARPQSAAARELLSDLQIMLLDGEGGLYAKELIEPGVFIVKSTEKCIGERLPKCLALTSRVVDAEEQVSLELSDGGLVAMANDTQLVIGPEGMNSKLTYTYKVDKLDQREGKVAVRLTLTGSPGSIEGGPLKVYVDPLLLELILAQKLLAFWRRPPPPAPATNCCYYIRLVGNPSCPNCAITTQGPLASCPNNIRTCGRATADSSLCLTKTVAAGAACPALTAAESNACKQGTSCP